MSDSQFTVINKTVNDVQAYSCKFSKLVPLFLVSRLSKFASLLREKPTHIQLSEEQSMTPVPYNKTSTT